MKSLLFILTFSFIATGYSQVNREFEMTEGDTTYVMKKYFMVFLNRGANRDHSKEEAAEIQKGHLEHIDSLAEKGYIILAGPFEGDGDKRGILLFDVDTAEEAVKLESEDPAVKAGRLVIEVLPWWGAKGSVLK